MSDLALNRIRPDAVDTVRLRLLKANSESEFQRTNTPRTTRLASSVAGFRGRSFALLPGTREKSNDSKVPASCSVYVDE